MRFRGQQSSEPPVRRAPEAGREGGSGGEIEQRLRRGLSGVGGSPTPSGQVRVEAGSVRVAMILRRPSQVQYISRTRH